MWHCCGSQNIEADATGLDPEAVDNGQAVIAVDGSYGTLSEIALALDAGLFVVGLNTHAISGVEQVDSPLTAVDAVETQVD